MPLADNFINPLNGIGVGAGGADQLFDAPARQYVAAAFDLPAAPIDNLVLNMTWGAVTTTPFEVRLFPDNGLNYPDTSVATISGQVASGLSGNGAVNLFLGFDGSGPAIAGGRYWLVVFPTNGTLRTGDTTKGGRGALQPAGLFGPNLANLIPWSDAGGLIVPDMVVIAYYDNTTTVMRTWAALVG